MTDGEATAPDDGVAGPIPRLEVLKTLGDDTRYAVYLELARSPRPRSTAEVAATLDLHPNTVRPHLERMRDLGLVEVTAPITGAVGRPQHRYALAGNAPSLGLEPPAFPALAGVLLDAAARAGLTAADLDDAARSEGLHGRAIHGPDPIPALETWLGGLGFDPARHDAHDGEHEIVQIAFGHCPFRSLAEAHPELVCGMHRGMVEGFVSDDDDVEVLEFHALAARTPCQVDLSRRLAENDAFAAR